MSINPKEIPTGAVRYNTDSNKMEVYIGSTWMEVSVTHEASPLGGRGLSVVVIHILLQLKVIVMLLNT